MTKANITQYSSTASSNTDIDDINIDENCPASGLNNALRSLMSHLKNVDTGSQALTALSVTGNVTVAGDIQKTSGDLTVDVAGDIILDADGGDIVIKDGGTSIGAISNTSSDLSIYSTASGHSGIRFHENGILPTNNAGALVDNDAVLGDASYRYTNLFLSGGVYLGGTGSANLLNDYEEGTFTPSITFGGGTTGISYVSGRQSGIYTKIGNCVTISIHLQMSSKGSSTGACNITGLPFTSSSNDKYTPCAVFIQAMASMSGGFPVWRVLPGGTSMDSYQLSSNTYSGITNSNCTDTTGFQISGQYYV